MFRVIREANQHTLEITLDGKVTRKDISHMKPWKRAKLVKKLFEWKANGAKGFPPLEE